MSFGGLVLTNLGRNELIKAETGEIFNLTHVVLGDGSYTGAYTAISSLVNKVMEIPITRISRTDREILLECDFNSLDVPRAFYLKEIGIIANGVLCYYDNSREDAEYIDPNADLIVKQKRLRFVLLISSEIQVNVKIDSSLYALAADLEGVIHPKYEETVELTEIEEQEEIWGILGKTKKAVKELINHVNNRNNPHKITKAQVGLGNVNNTSDVNKPVSSAQQAALDSYYQQSTGYTNQKIADLINGAPSTLDTLGEIAQAMADNADVVDALETSIGSKASEAEFDSHVKDTTAHVTAAERNNWSDPAPAFTQAGKRTNIASGEKLSVILGKIKKFFADLKTVAFSGSYNDLADKPTIPTSLPASGGDADTVDGLHSTDFIRQYGGGVIYDGQLYIADGITGGVVPSTVDAYQHAKIVVQANATTAKRAGIGFHNGGVVGALLYLENNGKFRKKIGDSDVALIDESGGTLRGHLNASEDNTWILGGETTNLLNVYTRNVESTNYFLYIKANSQIYLLCGTRVICARKENVAGYIPISASAFDVQSSFRIKENIADMTDEEAKKILDISVVTFDYIAHVGGEKDMRGCIAEDVAKIIPFAVNVPENYKQNLPVEKNTSFPSIDYSRFVPYLIKMMQIQQTEIDELRRRVDELEISVKTKL